MNDFTDWLAEEKKNNHLTVRITNVGNEFEYKRYELQSPDRTIPIVYLSVNNEGKISIFNTDTFHFSRFNIAEGFTEENFRSAALSFLSNSIKIRKSIFGQKYVELKFGKLIAYGKAGHTKY